MSIYADVSTGKPISGGRFPCKKAVGPWPALSSSCFLDTYYVQSHARLSREGDKPDLHDPVDKAGLGVKITKLRWARGP